MLRPICISASAGLRGLRIITPAGWAACCGGSRHRRTVWWCSCTALRRLLEMHPSQGLFRLPGCPATVHRAVAAAAASLLSDADVLMLKKSGKLPRQRSCRRVARHGSARQCPSTPDLGCSVVAPKKLPQRLHRDFAAWFRDGSDDWRFSMLVVQPRAQFRARMFFISLSGRSAKNAPRVPLAIVIRGRRSFAHSPPIRTR